MPPRTLALAALVLAGCPPVYTPADSASSTGAGTDATTESPATTTGGPVEPTTGVSIGTTTLDTTGAPDTTGEPGTTGTTAGTTEEPATGSSTGAPDPGLMGEWGHACASDDECAAILGDKAVCLPDILGLYELPGGYCTKECQLPDDMTMYEENDPVCGAEATCIGAKGYFEACAVECTDDSQCPREGYECRVLPVIGMPGDPMFCLMTDEHML